DSLCDRLLAAEHQGVRELRDKLVLVLRVRRDGALRYFSSSGHCSLSLSGKQGTFVRPGPGKSGLRALDAVLGPLAVTVGLVRRGRANRAGRVERAADDVVTKAREVLDAAAADEDDRVLLEVVTLARNVRRHFHAVREANAADLPESRVRLLRGRG